ncbi:MAG: IS3 family transposase, partial [Anaerocolumna sp.]
EFDLKSQTVYAWCKRYNSPSEANKLDEAPLTLAELENIELKKQLKQLEMENDILKQAALIIGKE